MVEEKLYTLREKLCPGGIINYGEVKGPNSLMVAWKVLSEKQQSYTLDSTRFFTHRKGLEVRQKPRYFRDKITDVHEDQIALDEDLFEKELGFVNCDYVDEIVEKQFEIAAAATCQEFVNSSKQILHLPLVVYGHQIES